MGLAMFSQGSLKWQIVAFIIHYKKAGGGFPRKNKVQLIITLSKSYLILNSSNFSNF